MADAARVVSAYRAAGLTVAVAESLTAGLVAARVADVPGASAVLRGAVVAYATDLKATLLGVDAALLTAVGAVHPDVAGQMAAGARERLGADTAVATTGVAGPTAQDGRAPGTVFVAVATAADVRVRGEHLAGDRAAVRAGTVDLALEMLLAAVGGTPAPPR